MAVFILQNIYCSNRPSVIRRKGNSSTFFCKIDIFHGAGSGKVNRYLAGLEMFGLYKLISNIMLYSYWIVCQNKTIIQFQFQTIVNRVNILYSCQLGLYLSINFLYSRIYRLCICYMYLHILYIVRRVQLSNYTRLRHCVYNWNKLKPEGLNNIITSPWPCILS